MKPLNLDKIRNDHTDWMTGLSVCPQPEGPCIRCQDRATVAAHHVPALIAEVERLRAENAEHRRTIRGWQEARQADLDEPTPEQLADADRILAEYNAATGGNLKLARPSGGA